MSKQAPPVVSKGDFLLFTDVSDTCRFKGEFFGINFFTELFLMSWWLRLHLYTVKITEGHTTEPCPWGQGTDGSSQAFSILLPLSFWTPSPLLAGVLLQLPNPYHLQCALCYSIGRTEIVELNQTMSQTNLPSVGSGLHIASTPRPCTGWKQTKSPFLKVRSGSSIQFDLIIGSTDPEIRISSGAHGVLLHLTSLLLEVLQRIKAAVGELVSKGG